MSIVIEDEQVSNLYLDIAAELVNHLYANTICPATFIQDLVKKMEPLDGVLIEKEAHRLWKAKEKEIEKQIIREQGDAIGQQTLKEMVVQRRKDIMVNYSLFPQLEKDSVSPDIIKSLLPEDKIQYNRDIFNRILEKVEFQDIPAVSEQRLVQTLERESIGLTKQEVVLYYNLIKIYKLSALIRKEEAQKNREESHFYKKYAQELLLAIDSHRFFKLEHLTQINNNTPIARESLEAIVLDKLQNKKMVAPPFLVLFGKRKQRSFFEYAAAFLAETKEWNEDPARTIPLFVASILLRSASEKLIHPLKLHPHLMAFLQGKPHKESMETFLYINYVLTFFYSLCSQCLEISNKYQKADEETQKKLFKLYNGRERIDMIINNALNVATKRMTAVAGKEAYTISDQHERLHNLIHKHKEILTREDVFDTSVEL